jgi:hypothetical protein
MKSKHYHYTNLLSELLLSYENVKESLLHLIYNKCFKFSDCSPPNHDTACSALCMQFLYFLLLSAFYYRVHEIHTYCGGGKKTVSIYLYVSSLIKVLIVKITNYYKNCHLNSGMHKWGQYLYIKGCNWLVMWFFLELLQRCWYMYGIRDMHRNLWGNIILACIGQIQPLLHMKL